MAAVEVGLLAEGIMAVAKVCLFWSLHQPRRNHLAIHGKEAGHRRFLHAANRLR